jgi:hypothetical protein
VALEKEIFEVVHMGDLISLPKRIRSLSKLLFKFDRQSPRVGVFLKMRGLGQGLCWAITKSLS